MPVRDAERVTAALVQMRNDPFGGDVVYLKGEGNALRRRVGNWRIIFDLDIKSHTVMVNAVLRRTSTTY